MKINSKTKIMILSSFIFTCTFSLITLVIHTSVNETKLGSFLSANSLLFDKPQQEDVNPTPHTVAPNINNPALNVKELIKQNICQ